MFFIQVTLGLPRPLFPSILPSSYNLWIDLILITCPKYWHFLFFTVGNKDPLVFAVFKTSSLVLCSVHDTLNILLYAHISKDSNLLSMVKKLHKLVILPNFLSIRIFWAVFICSFSILRNSQLELTFAVSSSSLIAPVDTVIRPPTLSVLCNRF